MSDEQEDLEWQFLQKERDLVVWQEQPTNTSCVPTCLAMMLGVPALKMTEFLTPSRMGMSNIETIVAVDKLEMWFFAGMFGSFWQGWHLVTAPSLNHVGGNHAILVWYGHSRMRVLDPARGKRYKEDGSDLNGWSDVMLIKYGYGKVPEK